MDKRLFVQAISRFTSGLIIVGLLLFFPAGTFRYWNAWLFIGVLFIPMFILGLVLLIKDEELLKKRLNSKEKENVQKLTITISIFQFLAGFILAGLDFKYGWTNIPIWLNIVGAILLLGSYGLYAEVMRENAYLSRTVEVQENQKVIDTGLYGIVRHPMYTTTIILFLSFPIVLGSWISFAVFLFYPILLIMRINNEEKVLEEGLNGYKEYKQKVKYKLLPFIW